MKRLAILLTLPWLLFGAEASVEQLFNVQTVKVVKEKVAFTRSYYGLLKTDETALEEVVPRFSGYIVKLYANRSFMKVEKGKPLARVYSPDVFKAKQEYLNALNYARKRGNRGMERSAREKLLLLGVKRSEIIACQKSGKADPYTTIYAPRSGYLFVKNVVEGSAFGAGKPLFRIADLRLLWMEAKIPETDIAQVTDARRFRVRPRALGREYEAFGPELLPDIDTKSALATLRLRVKNEKHDLIPGMYARLLVSKEVGERLVLPRTAVIRKMDKWYVFKAGEYEGEYEPVEVTVRPIDDERYAVLSGVKAGDVVVKSALFLIDSDAQINGLF